MSTGTLTKVSAKTAAEIAKLFPVGDEAKKLLRDGLTPRQYLDLLIEKQQFVDAVRFLAHALPKREGVWWACLSVRGGLGTALPAPQTAAVQAAERWVADPSEANRRAAETVANAAEPATPGGCTAMAAFWSGGSLAPANLPVVPPGETLTAHGVASAILLTAVASEPQKAPEKHRKFLAQGIEVANGLQRWKEGAR
jgi:hypothetical protein